eukprot:6573131-Pyramimonas_sp.AAC.1
MLYGCNARASMITLSLNLRRTPTLDRSMGRVLRNHLLMPARIRSAFIDLISCGTNRTMCASSGFAGVCSAIPPDHALNQIWKSLATRVLWLELPSRSENCKQLHANFLSTGVCTLIQSAASIVLQWIEHVGPS